MKIAKLYPPPRRGRIEVGVNRMSSPSPLRAIGSSEPEAQPSPLRARGSSGPEAARGEGDNQVIF
jgi:hypothetical protein